MYKSIATGFHAGWPTWVIELDSEGVVKMPGDIAAILDQAAPCPLITIRAGSMLVTNDDVEPMLEAAPESRLVLETDGTRELAVSAFRMWSVLVPVGERERTRQSHADELRVCIPELEPSEWFDFDASHFYLMAKRAEHIKQAADLVAKNYRWRLALDVARLAGVRS